MKVFFSLTALLLAASSAQAAGSMFCHPQASLAARSLANVNGTLSSRLASSNTVDGKSFTIALTEPGQTDVDRYVVRTNGGHDCLVLSVRAVSSPSLLP